MNEQQIKGLVYYEPCQTYLPHDGDNFLTFDGLILEDPIDYDYSNGFFKL